MAAVAESRLLPNRLTFPAIGADYFSPLLVERDRCAQKRCKYIFTHLTVMSVHIEFATILERETPFCRPLPGLYQEVDVPCVSVVTMETTFEELRGRSENVTDNGIKKRLTALPFSMALNECFSTGGKPQKGKVGTSSAFDGSYPIANWRPDGEP
ncbi:hypothetical protein EG68_05594 [Paragonimus skrjabini miyazakii]|uniref:Uncharacterized protein n=1 Tax=Paragonimus skrjabini miyazakii TaxID=59628 RepID=A0A8S9YV81_9TREM|nr:hypothetical protein EG68_05594 [Paragonimus skrjabini miyazakii]